MYALILTFCLASSSPCQEQSAGTFPTIELCDGAAQDALLKGHSPYKPISDDDYVLVGVTCRLM